MNDEHKEVGNTGSNKPWGMDLNVFCMLLHLSPLAGFVIPFVGLVLPVIMWATNKDEHPTVNLHGLIVLNWMLSVMIYAIAAVILMFILIGFPLMFAILILALVFSVIGAVKANEGKYWPYPLSIDFFGVKAKLADLSIDRSSP